MLILTRRIGESLVIGNDVLMTVLGVKGGQVRIGINAPKTVSVHREEIYEKIKNEQSNLNSIDTQSLINIDKVSYSKKKDFHQQEGKRFKNHQHQIQDKYFENKNNLKNFDYYKNHTNSSSNLLKKSKEIKEYKDDEDFSEDSIGNM